MNRIAKLVVIVLALSLSACVTIFPKTKPSQLYRFDGRKTEIAAANPAGPRIGIARAGGSFTGPAAGDSILTVTGTQVAYLAQSRWAQPAETMFNEAVLGAFNAGPGPARMVIRGEPARADFTLRLDVQRFEAVYDHGPRAAPEVRIEVHMVLIRASDHVLVKDETLAVQQRAGANRVASIVDAFDTAVGEVMTNLVAKTNSGVGAP